MLIAQFYKLSYTPYHNPDVDIVFVTMHVWQNPRSDKITTTGLASQDLPYSSPGRVWAS